MKIRLFAALAAAATAGAGCGDSGPRLVPVQGTVTLNGEPLEGAIVEFEPTGDNRDGLPGQDMTGPQGNYKAFTNGRAGLVPGKYKVAVTKYPDIKPQGAAADADGKEDPLMAQIMYDVEMQVSGRDGRRKHKDAAPDKIEAKVDREVPPEGGTIDVDVKAKVHATTTAKS